MLDYASPYASRIHLISSLYFDELAVIPHLVSNLCCLTACVLFKFRFYPQILWISLWINHFKGTFKRSFMTFLLNWVFFDQSCFLYTNQGVSRLL